MSAFCGASLGAYSVICFGGSARQAVLIWLMSWAATVVSIAIFHNTRS